MEHQSSSVLVQDGHDSQSKDGEGAPAVWDRAKLDDLRAAGEDLADLIKNRAAAENRARTLGHLDTEQVCPPWLREAEKGARQALQDAYQRAVPDQVREWAASVPGLGSGELFPRIIAIIGDPRTATPLLPIAKGDTGRGARSQPDGDPYDRTLRQLWQWCGIGDPDRLPREDILGRKPTQADMLAAGKRTQLRPLLFTWSSQLAKMATPVTKEGSKRFGQPMSEYAAASRYAQIFRERKEKGATKVHQRQCQNHARPPAHSNGCGTVLHPEWGEPGSLWRPGHVNMDAHRVVAKEFLRDLWKVAGDE
jgi:hypothetical protein